MKIHIPFCCVLLGFSIAVTAPAFGLEAGSEAPAFSLPHLRKEDGTKNLNLADYRGTVVYVDFWASWCAPCLVSVPLLNDMRNRLQQQGKKFEVLAVNVDQEPEDGVDFLLDEPVQYVTISDPSGATPKSYEVKGMPTSFLVDAEGKIRLIHEGFKATDIEMIEMEINKLLAEEP